MAAVNSRDKNRLEILGTFCKPKFGNFDGNGPRPGERCETKWHIGWIFGKIHPNVRLEGPGTVQNFRFGSGWPVRAAHVAMCFGSFGLQDAASTPAHFVSSSVMSSFLRSSSSTASISSSPVCSPAPNPRPRNHRSLPRMVS